MRRPSARLVANLLWLPALAIGALQMKHVDAGAITNHGADFFGPIALYGSFRVNGTIARWFTKRAPSPLMSAVIVFTGCLAWELCQLRDFAGTPLAITKGSFDVIDIVAYAAGVGAAFGVEKGFAVLSGARSAAAVSCLLCGLR